MMRSPFHRLRSIYRSHLGQSIPRESLTNNVAPQNVLAFVRRRRVDQEYNRLLNIGGLMHRQQRRHMSLLSMEDLKKDALRFYEQKIGDYDPQKQEEWERQLLYLYRMKPSRVLDRVAKVDDLNWKFYEPEVDGTRAQEKWDTIYANSVKRLGQVLDKMLFGSSSNEHIQKGELVNALTMFESAKVSVTRTLSLYHFELELLAMGTLESTNEIFRKRATDILQDNPHYTDGFIRKYSRDNHVQVTREMVTDNGCKMPAGCEAKVLDEMAQVAEILQVVQRVQATYQHMIMLMMVCDGIVSSLNRFSWLGEHLGTHNPKEFVANKYGKLKSEIPRDGIWEGFMESDKDELKMSLASMFYYQFRTKTPDLTLEVALERIRSLFCDIRMAQINRHATMDPSSSSAYAPIRKLFGRKLTEEDKLFDLIEVMLPGGFVYHPPTAESTEPNGGYNIKLFDLEHVEMKIIDGITPQFNMKIRVVSDVSLGISTVWGVEIDGGRWVNPGDCITNLTVSFSNDSDFQIVSWVDQPLNRNPSIRKVKTRNPELKLDQGLFDYLHAQKIFLSKPCFRYDNYDSFDIHTNLASSGDMHKRARSFFGHPGGEFTERPSIIQLGLSNSTVAGIMGANSEKPMGIQRLMAHIPVKSFAPAGLSVWYITMYVSLGQFYDKAARDKIKISDWNAMYKKYPTYSGYIENWQERTPIGENDIEKDDLMDDKIDDGSWKSYVDIHKDYKRVDKLLTDNEWKKHKNK